MISTAFENAVPFADGDRRLLNDPEILARGHADVRGVPLIGRERESLALREMGYRDLALGRLYEGHVNALQLIALLGTPAQRAAYDRDVAAGKLFGVWNTQAADGVVVETRGERSVLSGRKTFCSGAGRVARAMITARTASDRLQLYVIDMEREATTIDTSFWKPSGMVASESYAVDFTGIALGPDDRLGAEGAYERPPWFIGGAHRFLAVQTGGVERLAAEFARFVAKQNRADDPFTLARVGASAVAAGTAVAWTRTCAEAWAEHDAGKRSSVELLASVDAARIAIERAALDAAETIERGVSARGLLEPWPFGRLLADLRMYLRQPSPDQALMRVARAALAAVSPTSETG